MSSGTKSEEKFQFPRLPLIASTATVAPVASQLESSIEQKGWVSHPEPTNQNLVYGRESLGTPSLPCALESWEEVVREMTSAVQGPLCSIVG